MEVTRSKRKRATRWTNTQSIQIVLQSTMFLGCIRPRRPHDNICQWSNIILGTVTDTHSHFMALRLGLPGWAGTRRDIHSPTHMKCVVGVCHHSRYCEVWPHTIIEASAPTIRLDATSSGPSMLPPPSSPQFYAGCPSCRNPPTLSWIGTNTKYSGLHTWRLGTETGYK